MSQESDPQADKVTAVIETLFKLTIGVFVVLCIGVAFLGWAAGRAFEGLPEEAVENPDDWPDELKSLLTKAGLDRRALPEAKVYRYSDRGFHAFYYWELPAEPELVAAILQKSSMEPASIDSEATATLLKRPPTGWIPPELDHDCEVFKTIGYFEEYLEGCLYVVVHDKPMGRLVVLYEFNF